MTEDSSAVATDLNQRRVALTFQVETLRLRALAEGYGDLAAWCLTIHAAAWASGTRTLRDELPGWERDARRLASRLRPVH